MIDYVLINKHFRTSVLDTHVYRLTFHESDHELVVSALCFKIKAKCGHHATEPPTSPLFTKLDNFKSSIRKTCEFLHLLQKLVTLTGSPMKSTSCPGRSLGSFEECTTTRHHLFQD